MPIKIPSELPARKVLESEGVPIIKDEDAIRQDIRPLRIAILNLMPEKIKTETQLARVLGATPLQVEVTLLALTSHKPKTTPEQHLLDFYHPWTEVRDQKFDGLIVTGAPIEKLPFEDVRYWPELCDIFDWSLTNVHGCFNLCWGAQAALYHFYGIPKHQLPHKAFGVFWHNVLDSTSPLMRGLNDAIPIPVSRHTENHRQDVEKFKHLQVLAESADVGMALVNDPVLNHVHMFNHLEYDSTTLGDEYLRDVAKGSEIDVPRNYYPDNDPSQVPVNTWRSNAHILFGNWINGLYQSTPYDLAKIGQNRPAVPKADDAA
ncbi:MAG: homoserine O-succinyltransferase [Rhodospirillales bacterium]|nr:homoserine O-succinyltransferase [Rhodospirillales bacterium]MBO6786198.1 homoserine O-succinyltransferase [Rhodospirillales bacterium]